MNFLSKSLFIVTVAAAVPSASAQTLPRSANGGEERPRGGAEAVQVPRYPYAGAWEGVLTSKDSNGLEVRSRVAMTFTVADGARQAYAGETAIDGPNPVPHVNISAAPAEPAGATGASGAVARRSPGEIGETSGPSAAAKPERDVLADGTHALLMYHWPSKSMVLCDAGHRCIGLAALTWEEVGADRRRYRYLAMLTDADTISGTVAVIDDSSAPAAGTFTLKRRK